ncbi:MAG TPA: polyprenyl synthetase family protein [Noviherbaspirillum sp.]|jgi:geranylgeranyl diphosphate synthase type II|uniref:polyprenyl synthetase family protein n=1 Tax=Noviherbaspirillum sp. TaxID=1926288 RepID=UPI002DDDA61F|nr:polyprenyl synthetase family protein [Noviherbaspirillum sp.]HEV2612921.1 polyprenyl synthetase family protein [Noviherbaspirillum sp.]
MLAINAVDYTAGDWITQTRQMIEDQLDHHLSLGQTSPVSEAMRYSVLAGGKRIRPLLTMAVTKYLGCVPAHTIDVACAIEMIHSASLILDDLPCMDNDNVRRNRVSTHVKFGESLTILAAVSLLTHSQCMIASHDSLPGELRLKLIRLLCDTVGAQGLSLGQYIDLNTKVETTSPAAISDMHHLKTGVLFVAAAKAACMAADASPEKQQQVMHFTTNIGLAFQLLDDIKDADAEETNLVTRIGVTSAQRKVREYLQAANIAIEGEQNAEVLQSFVREFFRKT